MDHPCEDPGNYACFSRSSHEVVLVTLTCIRTSPGIGSLSSRRPRVSLVLATSRLTSEYYPSLLHFPWYCETVSTSPDLLTISQLSFILYLILSLSSLPFFSFLQHSEAGGGVWYFYFAYRSRGIPLGLTNRGTPLFFRTVSPQDA